MANIKKEQPKTEWSKFEMFKDDPLVPLFIPKDKVNPVKQVWLCLNGQEIWLATNTQLTVPKSLADLWNYSYAKTSEAEEKMEQNIQIG